MALRMWRSLRTACFVLTTAVCASSGFIAPAYCAPLQSSKDMKKPVQSANQPIAATPAEAQNSGYVLVIDQDLAQILKEFGRRKGIAVQVDAEVKKRITNQKIPLERAAFLKFVSDHYDLTVIQDENVISFSPPSQILNRMFSLNNVQSEDVIKTAKATGIDLHQYSLRTIPETNAIVINAPASVLGQVAAIIESLAASRQGVTIVKYGNVTGVTPEPTQNSK